MLNNTIQDSNYHGKYNMKCQYIRKAPYTKGMMCMATTYGTCMCETCSHKEDTFSKAPEVF